VVSTTHSPHLLTMIGDETFKHTSVIFRRPDTANAIIRRVDTLPNAGKLRQSQGLGRLHASGWMEDMLTFIGNENDDTSENE